VDELDDHDSDGNGRGVGRQVQFELCFGIKFGVRVPRADNPLRHREQSVRKGVQQTASHVRGIGTEPSQGG
jgi:hypothetical protein